MRSLIFCSSEPHGNTSIWNVSSPYRAVVKTTPDSHWGKLLNFQVEREFPPNLQILGFKKAYLFRNQILFKTRVLISIRSGHVIEECFFELQMGRSLGGFHWNVNLFSIGVACLDTPGHIALLLCTTLCLTHLLLTLEEQHSRPLFA